MGALASIDALSVGSSLELSAADGIRAIATGVAGIPGPPGPTGPAGAAGPTGVVSFTQHSTVFEVLTFGDAIQRTPISIPVTTTAGQVLRLDAQLNISIPDFTAATLLACTFSLALDGGFVSEAKPTLFRYPGADPTSTESYFVAFFGRTAPAAGAHSIALIVFGQSDAGNVDTFFTIDLFLTVYNP